MFWLIRSRQKVLASVLGQGRRSALLTRPLFLGHTLSVSWLLYCLACFISVYSTCNKLLYDFSCRYFENMKSTFIKPLRVLVRISGIVKNISKPQNKELKYSTVIKTTEVDPVLTVNIGI